jgi:hypothetical protein
VKIADAVSGRPILSFYASGGSTLQVEVPAGSFVLKYATGDRWCGEQDLFSPLTEISEINRVVHFDGDHGYLIDLIRRRNGNLSTKKISREAF